jgi:hypothetical protein
MRSCTRSAARPAVTWSGVATPARALARLRAPIAALAVLALAGCLGNSGSPSPPPTNVQAYAGDATISITWDDDPFVAYWLFYAQDPSVTPFNLDNGVTTLLNFGYVVPTASPTILCNSAFHTVINQSTPAVENFPPYFFTINGRTGTAKGGAGSIPVSTLPRGAAGPGVPWVSGAAIPGTMRGLGYIGLTGCGYSNHPPSGLYVAVGESGAIYTSTLAPTLAGPLTNPGNAALTWNAAVISEGFGANLNAVAGRAANPNTPGNPNLLLVAVGDGGATARSFDGINWQATSPVLVNSYNLNDVAYANGEFIAVGDHGVVLNSVDGLNWTVNQYANTVNPNGTNLHAVRCSGLTCFAVGDAGTTLLSTNNGLNWQPLPFGTNNWTCIAFGGADANADNVFFNGLYYVVNEPLNTWVVADAQGNFGYLSGATGNAWLRGTTAIAPDIVALDYTSSFVALDRAGNAWISERGNGNWASYTAAPVGSGSAVALRSNGNGYVALGASGANAASF